MYSPARTDRQETGGGCALRSGGEGSRLEEEDKV